MDTGHRWLGVGHSAEGDPRRAGRAAARRSLRGPDPALLIVFASGVPDPPDMLAGIHEVCPGVPLIGCSSDLLVARDIKGQHGVVITTLGGPGFTVRTGTGSCAQDAQRLAGAAVARCVGDLHPDDDRASQRVLVLLTDGWVSDQDAILAGAYSEVGASIPLIGGSASPDRVIGRPYQLCGEDVLYDAAVGAAISSDGPLGFGVRHGWREVGEPMIVTRAAQGNVQTLDDRPALAAYLERYEAPRQAYTDPSAFEAFALRRPIGIRRRHGVEVRSVSSSAGLADGCLRPTGEVPEGALVWLMAGDVDSALDAAGEACRDAVRELGGAAPLGLVAFDCVSRSYMLGAEGARVEVDRMLEQSAGAPVAGVYTWGEILRTRGANGYHNQTLAVLAVG
jgi:hypothetical protein